ncbi:MAG: deoxyribodipyrimidine photo-lyase, partial [Xanthomonadales bacterium]|nr:deoxyribodipyrimidine photo-lyase [Xanthomonadales bacterium]NIO14983.1 deoxyribodipyrimidine photo-lyase [Xanthomonadales bacterium]NIP77221.1 deoxyribodipyrimidine photo-lyase [Xanthomonadales bacterium]NIQ34984.1 deoxyribodipyrimidine photo-lyase [Xanthomonadales bacterium]
FRRELDALQWRHAPEDYEAWKAGETGYPLVDAAMRQLNETGWMHNRLRMVAAMFLSKHLLLDWRLGERYFMQKLV